MRAPVRKNTQLSLDGFVRFAYSDGVADHKDILVASPVAGGAIDVLSET
jgi:hypothetical protein